MAKEANYLLKLTLTEAATVEAALIVYRAQLEESAQRLIARREGVPPNITERLDAAARLLARI